MVKLLKHHQVMKSGNRNSAKAESVLPEREEAPFQVKPEGYIDGNAHFKELLNPAFSRLQSRVWWWHI